MTSASKASNRYPNPVFTRTASIVGAVMAITTLACSGTEPTPIGVGGGAAAGGGVAAGGFSTPNGGAAMGGNVGSGGSQTNVSSGGRLSQGGSASLGGTTAAGGSKSSGGNSSAGGVQATGGTTASGGGNAIGGTSSAGGTKASGGSASGGRASGGTNSGGSSNSGGSASGGKSSSGGSAPAGGSSAAGGGASKFHVFLLLGQSNMAGFPKALQNDKVEDARIKVLGYDTCAATGRQPNVWDTAAPPLHECGVGAIGPGDYFAKTILGKIPSGDTIGLVPCAISGEKIETFMKVGGTKYDWIIQRAKLAQQAGGVIEGILFHQGESNNGDTTWPGKVNTLITNLRTDLGIGNVPFLAGELLYSGGCAGHNTLVNQLPSVVGNAYVISASGLVVDPTDTQWNLHFSHDSQVTFGQRYAQKMIEVLKW